MPKKPKIEAVDLFCGAGGLTCGLRAAGVTVKAGYDFDPNCRHPFEANNGAEFVQADIYKVTGKDIERHYSPGAVKLLAGCAPCQPFSTYSHGLKVEGTEKWGLLFEFARLVDELQPELVAMENVPGARNHVPYQAFKARLIEHEYFLDEKVVYCPDYGIPQKRKRLVLIASKIGAVKLREPDKSLRKTSTVRSAIADLPFVKNGETHPDDPLHKARELTPINLERIRHSVPNGTWEDWPERLKLACHKKICGSTFKGVYGRMAWDEPSPTMTTQCFNYGTGRFGHPEQDRPVTLREAATLQSFPVDYEFVPKGKPAILSTVGRLIGNAVPPKLGEIVGEAFLSE